MKGIHKKDNDKIMLLKYNSYYLDKKITGKICWFSTAIGLLYNIV